MPSIFIQPWERQDARVSINAAGVEFLSFSGVLDRRMNVRFAKTNRPFPTNGNVRLRRGSDFTDTGEQVVNSFRYEESHEDSNTGNAVPERWTVYLQLEECAFDRLIQRLHWGLPELSLMFDLSSEVVTFHPGTDWENLYFSPEPRPWERITEARLSQVPLTS